MICKKCGREYDDMPKCLWCDAPNDSKVDSSIANPADKIEPEEAAPLTECEVRGDQAIYWLKAFFFASLIMIILPITAIIYWETTNVPFDNDILYKILSFWFLLVPLLITALCPPLVLLWPVIALATLASCIFLVISLCKCVYHYCSWLHYSETEQSHFSKMRFSPDVAVICTLIPVIGPVFQYFIFRELLAWQKEVLEMRHQDYRNLPGWLLPVISASGFIMQSGLLSICVLKEWIPIVWFASVFSGIFLFAIYIKIIRTVTANTRALLSPTETDTPPTDAPDDTPSENS